MSKRKLFREQDELEEQEILAKRDPMQEALDYFFAGGMISEVLYTVKSGKEATVYCCQARPSMGADLLAAKVYRPRTNRSFKNDAIYQEGRVILKGQVRRAVEKKTRFGREAQFAIWRPSATPPRATAWNATGSASRSSSGGNSRTQSYE